MKNSNQHAVNLTAKRGFTLIELLVVIAIIAILASILFPVFGRARENARRSSCQSNLKQIGLGILQYTQDYDEAFPLYTLATDPVPGPGVATEPYGWADSIQPYLKSEQIFQCPSDTTAPPNAATAILRAASNGYTDYVYNVALSRSPGSTRATAVSQAALTNPTLTVMLIDGRSVNGGSVYQTGSARQATRGSGGGPARATDPNIAAQRHLEGANTLFGDGHVKFYRGSDPQTMATIWNANTSFQQSGQDPTFHTQDGGTTPAPNGN